MTPILDLVQGDICSTLVLVLLLVLVGAAMVGSKPVLHQWGKRLAAAAGVGWVLYGASVDRPTSAADWTGLVLQSLLASGLMLGTAWVVLCVLGFLSAYTAAPLLRQVRGSVQAGRRRAAQALDQTARAEQEEARRRRERAEQERQAAEREGSRELAERAERDRTAKCQDARAEVLRFYEDHAQLIHDAFPAGLFRAQLQTRFPDDITPEQAWQAAGDLIAGMLPLIAQGRERQREQEQQRRQQAERARSLERQIRALEEGLAQLTGSAAADPDVVADEVRETRRQIRALTEERQALDSSDQP